MQKLYRNKFKITIYAGDGRSSKDYTSHAPFPLKWARLLDERLDEGSLTLLNVSESSFLPFSPVVIETWNEKDPSRINKLTFFVADDSAEELPPGSGKYKHTLTLIEETKYLERFIVRSHAYLNTLGKIYVSAQSYVEATGLSD